MSFTPSQKESLTRRWNTTRPFHPAKVWNSPGRSALQSCRSANLRIQLRSLAARYDLSWSSRTPAGTIRSITALNPRTFGYWPWRTKPDNHSIGSVVGSTIQRRPNQSLQRTSKPLRGLGSLRASRSGAARGSRPIRSRGMSSLVRVAVRPEVIREVFAL